VEKLYHTRTLKAKRKLGNIDLVQPISVTPGHEPIYRNKPRVSKAALAQAKKTVEGCPPLRLLHLDRCRWSTFARAGPRACLAVNGVVTLRPELVEGPRRAATPPALRGSDVTLPLSSSSSAAGEASLLCTLPALCTSSTAPKPSFSSHWGCSSNLPIAQLLSLSVRRHTCITNSCTDRKARPPVALTNRRRFATAEGESATVGLGGLLVKEPRPD